MRTASGTRNLNYCRHHTDQFANSYGLRPPRLGVDEIHRIKLGGFTRPALVELYARIEAEIERRDRQTEDICFDFEESGPRKGKERPYVARLSAYESGTKSYFFPDTIHTIDDPSDPERVLVQGHYCVRVGSIIDKRTNGTDGQTPNWFWYLVTSTGEEVPVAMPQDQERRKLVLKYLRGEIKAQDLLEDDKA
ncbi:MAG: hypothetical protein KKB70_08355 [Proteobacteria bacterium]|nr:hypothetical protein [Pseudomonadota bacterium]